MALTMSFVGLSPVLLALSCTADCNRSCMTVFVDLAPRPTGSWPGGPPVTCLTGAGLGKAGRLAGGNTDGILIVCSLILPLQIHLERWDQHLAKLPVFGPDDEVGRQEPKVLLGPPLPGSQLLGTLA